MSIEHLQPGEIKSYVNGELGEIEIERVIEHVSNCEICLELVDLAWGNLELSESVDSSKIKMRLMRKIHRTNLIGHFIRLSGKGFLVTFLGLLYPLKNKTSVITQTREEKS